MIADVARFIAHSTVAAIVFSVLAALTNGPVHLFFCMASVIAIIPYGVAVFLATVITFLTLFDSRRD